jgi:hypothetical protein
MKFSLSYLFLELLILVSHKNKVFFICGQGCNICGEGNVMGDTKGVVKFEYKNQTLQNNCLRWQAAVRDNDTISDDFCRGEMLNYTIGPCKCVNSEGKLITEIRKEEQENVEEDKESGGNSDSVANETSGGSGLNGTASASGSISGFRRSYVRHYPILVIAMLAGRLFS